MARKIVQPELRFHPRGGRRPGAGRKKVGHGQPPPFLHFVLEANDHVALARGVQGLMVRLAKALNRMMQRSGRVFDDHFHARLPRTAVGWLLRAGWKKGLGAVAVPGWT